MTAFRANIVADQNGNPAMLVTAEPSENDHLVFFGSDEMMTLTPKETEFRDKVCDMLASQLGYTAPQKPGETPPADIPQQKSILDHIKQNPLMVMLGFGIGIITFMALMISLRAL